MKNHYKTNPRDQEVNRKISVSMAGTKKSPETKKRMADSKTAFYQTPAGQENKRQLSRLTAEGHSKNKFENAKRQGWFWSDINQRNIFYGSSYELLLCSTLEDDVDVASYQTQIVFETNDKGRCLDFLICYNNGLAALAIEVKPKTRLHEAKVIDQITDSKAYAESQGWRFAVYTEDDFGMSPKEIRDWADAFRSNQDGIDRKALRKELDRRKAKNHYDAKIAEDKVVFWCSYCEEMHERLRVTHDRNISNNGRFICHAENAVITGKLPKKKRDNPHAADGKKQCVKCGKVKLYNAFGDDKSRSDGYASRCKECRRKPIAST